ncbi:SigE family RNA polymerase sigma factor [Nocardioides sp. HB32]
MDQDADFSEYARARWASLVRAGVVLGCTVDEAHDLAQPTLLRCYTSWRRVQRADDRDAYVYKVLLNCHRSNRRRMWWGERATADVPDLAGDDPTASVDTTDAVRRALADLGPAYREVVVLRYFAHLSEKQTAAILGIATGTVKSRMSRAVAQLSLSPHLVPGAE